MKLGDRFNHGGFDYEIKDISPTVVRASKVNPETDRAQVGAPKNFKVEEMMAILDVVEQPAVEPAVEPAEAAIEAPAFKKVWKKAEKNREKIPAFIKKNHGDDDSISIPW